MSSAVNRMILRHFCLCWQLLSLGGVTFVQNRIFHSAGTVTCWLHHLWFGALLCTGGVSTQGGNTPALGQSPPLVPLPCRGFCAEFLRECRWLEVAASDTSGAGQRTNPNHSVVLGHSCCGASALEMQRYWLLLLPPFPPLALYLQGIRKDYNSESVLL